MGCLFFFFVWGWGGKVVPQTFRFAPSLPRLTARAPPVHVATGGHGFAVTTFPPTLKNYAPRLAARLARMDSIREVVSG